MGVLGSDPGRAGRGLKTGGRVSESRFIPLTELTVLRIGTRFSFYKITLTASWRMD